MRLPGSRGVRGGLDCGVTRTWLSTDMPSVSDRGGVESFAWLSSDIPDLEEIEGEGDLSDCSASIFAFISTSSEEISWIDRGSVGGSAPEDDGGGSWSLLSPEMSARD